MIEVCVNGDKRAIAQDATVLQLLRILDLDTKRVAVEVNGVLVVRQMHENYRLKDADSIEIVHFVGGG